MEQFQYRANARLVAIVDLVLTIISLWAPLMIAIAAIGVTVVSEDDELQKKFKEAIANAKQSGASITMDSDISRGVQFAAVLLWILFVIVMIILILQFVAISKLLNATTMGRRPAEAAKLAGFWRNLTIVFTVLGIIGGIVSLSSVGIALSIYYHLFSWGSIILNCIGIYIVHQFVSELEVAAAKTGILPSHHGQVPMTTGIPGVITLPLQGYCFSPPNYNEAVKEVKG